MIIQPSFYGNADRTGHFVENWPTWKYSKRLKVAALFNCQCHQLFPSRILTEFCCQLSFSNWQWSSADKLELSLWSKVDSSGILTKYFMVKKRWLSLNPISYCLENKCIFILPRRALGNNDYVQFWYCVCTKAVKKILLHDVMGIWAEKGCWLRSLGLYWKIVKIEISQGPLITDERNSKEMLISPPKT